MAPTKLCAMYIDIIHIREYKQFGVATTEQADRASFLPLSATHELSFQHNRKESYDYL